MLRGVKLTSLLKHCILELLQVSDRQDIDLVSYAEPEDWLVAAQVGASGELITLHHLNKCRWLVRL